MGVYVYAGLRRVRGGEGREEVEGLMKGMGEWVEGEYARVTSK
jgi:hypothetical protein